MVKYMSKRQLLDCVKAVALISDGWRWNQTNQSQCRFLRGSRVTSLSLYSYIKHEYVYSHPVLRETRVPKLYGKRG
jgi:hypothetical protein